MASNKRVLLINSKGYKNYNLKNIEVDFYDLLDCENYCLEKKVFDDMIEKISKSVESEIQIIVKNCHLLFEKWNKFISSSDGLNSYNSEDTRVLSYGIEFLEKLAGFIGFDIILDSKVECKDRRITKLYKHIYLD